MKKTWKRWSALLLAAVMTLSLFPTAALAARMDDTEVALDAPDVAPAADTAEVEQPEENAGPAVLMATVEEPTNAIAIGDYTLKAGSTVGTSGAEGPVANMIDSDDQTHWHTNYNSSEGSDVNNRWVQISLSSAKWLTAFAYYPRQNGSNGYVTAYRIDVCSDEDVTEQSVWATVAEGDGWTSNASWQLAQFGSPIYAKHVRLYGIHTSADSGADAHMTAAEVRLIGDTKQDYDQTRSISGAVKDGNGEPLVGASVAIGGKMVKTTDGGQFTVTGLLPNQTYKARVSKDGYATAVVEVDASTTTGVEVTLRWTIAATDATYDYPLTDAMVEAMNETNPPDWVNDGYDHWAIDYEDHWWHQKYDAAGEADVWFSFSLPQAVSIAGIRYQQRDGNDRGFGDYEIQTSENGTDWSAITGETGTWADDDHNPHFHLFAQSVSARYFRVHRTNGNAQNRAVKTFQLVLAPEGQTTVTGKVTKGSDEAVAGATVTVYKGDTATYKTATTDSDGSYSIVLPKDSTNDWKLAVTAPGCKPSEATAVSTSEAAAVQNIELEPKATVLKGNGFAGTTIQLMQSSDYALVEGMSKVCSEGNTDFSLDVSTLPVGTYQLRVWKDGCVPTWKEVAWDYDSPNEIEITGLTEPTALTPVADDFYKTYTFDNATDVNAFTSFVANKTDTNVTHENGTMKITFTKDNKVDSAMVDKSFVMKNGSVDFDVTPAVGTTTGERFGLALRGRYQDGVYNWLHVSGKDSKTAWMAQRYHDNNSHFNVNGEDKEYYLANSWNSTPIMQPGVSRHVHVAVSDADVTISIDGKSEVKASENGFNELGVGYFGFANNTPSTYFIDNIYIERTDAKSRVNFATLENGTITAKIVTDLDNEGTELSSGGFAYAGDTVKVTATPTNESMALGKLQVTEHNGEVGATVTATPQSDGSFIFTMPAQAVTITATMATKLTDAMVTVSGAHDGTGVTDPSTETPFPENYVRQGETLTAAPAEHVSYQWQKKVGEGEWKNIATATEKTFVPTGLYNGAATTLIRVQVTGDGENLAGVVNSTAYTLLNAVTEVTAVTFQRNQVTMWSNLTEDPNGGDPAEEGSTTTVRAFISPGDVSRPLNVEWTTSSEETVSISEEATKATVEGDQLVVTAKLTALKATAANTPVTITCKVTAKDGSTPVTATLPVTVKTKTKSVKVAVADAQGDATETEVTEAAPLVLYTNVKEGSEGKPIDANHPNSVKLIAVPNPEDATDKTEYNWHRTDDATGLIEVKNSDNEAHTRTIAVTGISEQNVGEKTIQVKIGDQVCGAFRVVVLRHLVHDVTVGLAEGATEARPGVKVEAVTSALKIGDDGVKGLTYQWYRKGASDSEAQAITTNGTDKTYQLTDADIGCEITVKVTATPEYGKDAENKYYYEGELTSTNHITVDKNAGPVAPAVTTQDVQTQGGKGSFTITSPASGAIYQYASSTAGDADDATGWTDIANPANAVEVDAGSYKVRIKATNTHHAGVSVAVNIAGYDQQKHTVSITVETQDFEGNVNGDLTGGTHTIPAEMTESTPYTFTVTPNEAYQIESVTFDGTAQTATSTDSTTRAATYTYTAVAGNTAITVKVTFKQRSVTITHNFTNLVCNLGNQPTNTHTVAYGSTPVITVSLANGVDPKAYQLPENGASTSKVTEEDGTTPFTNYSYNQTSGEFKITGGLTKNIIITASAQPRQYSVSRSLVEHTTLDFADGAKATYGTDFVVNLTPETDYSLPETVTVKRGANSTSAAELTANTDYTYDKNAKKLTIKGASITDNLFVTVQSVKNKTQLTGVTIEITHNDSTGMSDASKNTPHVGDLLTAKASPDGASVTYEWYADAAKISGANTATYTVAQGDLGKTIKVVVTGTGDYDGSKEATTVAVAEKIWRVSGVSLDKNTATIVFGETETLTATITPATATNKKVTWAVTEGSDVVSIATNAAVCTVTALKVGNATITVTTEDGSISANCAITVTAKALPTLQIGTPQVGKTVKVSFAGGASTDVATYEWYVGDSADATNWVRQNDVTGASWAIEGIPSGKFIKVIAHAKSGGNYTGSAEVVSAAILGSGETLPTRTVTFTLNGAALEIISGQTASDGAVAVEDGSTLTFKLTMADDTKEVKSVKADNAAITPVEGVYTIDNVVEDMAVVVEVGEKAPEVNTAELEAAIEAAKEAKKNVDIRAADTDPATVPSGVKFVSQEVMDALNAAIATAEGVLNNADATQENVNEAVTALDEAVETFQAAIKTGTKSTSTSRPSTPSSSTSTETKEDGTKVTTVTKPDGTKTVTTESPDGSKEVVETKKDGTVTETKTDPEGAKTEKVTDPEENVTITVTDPEGEELAKVEIPAAIPETETRFDDVPEGHWADEAIHKMAGLELVNGTGGNKYSPAAAMTRGTLATVLHRLSQGKTDYATTFKDVAAGKFYTEGVAWAAKVDVVKGVSTDIFAPEDIITREQLATMLCRYAKLVGLDTAADSKALEAFSDSDSTGAWAVDGMAWCVSKGILQGKGGSVLDPTASVSRAEVATMLDRFIGLLK